MPTAISGVFNHAIRRFDTGKKIFICGLEKTVAGIIYISGQAKLAFKLNF